MKMRDFAKKKYTLLKHFIQTELKFLKHESSLKTTFWCLNVSMMSQTTSYFYYDTYNKNNPNETMYEFEIK